MEVDRVEVLSILDRSHIGIILCQIALPGELMGIVFCTPGYMVNRADSNTPARLIRQAQYINSGTWATSAYFISETIAFLRNQTKTEHIREHGSCPFFL